MVIRVAVSCSLVLSFGVAAAPAVAAKPKPPVCKLVVDAKGDGGTSTPGTKSDALDITGADVATGRKQLVGVLRVVTTDTANDPLAYFGMEWSVNFTVRGTSYSFERRRVAGMAETYRYEFNGSAQDVKVTETATEIRWVVPRKAVPELSKPKPVLETLAATSRWFTSNADAASSTKKYADLTPSCLKPA
jgi:hypothetical protein